MNYYARLTDAFHEAPHLPLHEQSNYVLFSDCHRGMGTSNDNYLKNQNLYLAALKHYYKEGYTYIELGDGDELWENRCLDKIEEIHSRTFSILSSYFAKNRLFMIYGNHDRIKGAPYSCHSSAFPGLIFHSGIILQDAEKQKDVYLTHGHQADFLNASWWKFARLLVRYLWKPLEHFGATDPTSAAINNIKKHKTERRLTHWARKEDRILIAGHTHRPMLGTRQSPYFNTGSCVHPKGVTCIEVTGRCMTLIKWSLNTRSDMTLYVDKDTLAGPICIDDYGITLS